ncbi:MULTISPECIES: response regulator transcription factor [Gilliamella]|jgi:Response regulators consisting of a CheY-like receiver domain and a winged-helix DNA-binding domain|uniref:DNA-binding response regulator n=1 Tax=Gilliamella apis TaxID=1970738 RepID=A0A242NU98_9GAMM|nr:MULTISPECIES: response regulator transcription factor [Gilliamella]MBI0036633.1 response regulator transcription factor [Gilliamella sp. B14384G10]MBI0040756.1 response regulator transcription factor [Gilliamella sp. B14384G7]MBI0050628.1 response regulator transcription factor [Gilliamella sp. B14384G13]MBI0052920.1 response regulator transcription factor [Gilliamella sp. B14384H2]MBI0103167.1 response regulator transcription factor [Gilliamella sp. W8145]
MKILIAEDDKHILNGMSDLLEKEGYIIIKAVNGKVALELFNQYQPDFIILDIMMPELDGYSVCRAIRKLNEDVPILFLSAKDEEIDRVIGLELGADDYMNKPFGIHELRARIKAIAKRYLKSKHRNLSKEDYFQFGDLNVYPTELYAKRNDQIIELTLREIKILECLYQYKNQVVTRDMLFDYVWGYDFLPNSRTLDQHISKLRKQIEINPSIPTLIKTVHGIGYRH